MQGSHWYAIVSQISDDHSKLELVTKKTILIDLSSADTHMQTYYSKQNSQSSWAYIPSNSSTRCHNIKLLANGYSDVLLRHVGNC